MELIRNHLIGAINVSWHCDSSMTIEQIGNKTIEILLALSEHDSLFSTVQFVNDNNERTKIDIFDSQNSTALSELILSNSKTDIRKHEKDENPNIEYKRDFGFSILLIFQRDGRDFCSWMSHFGSKGHNGISLNSFKSDFQDSFPWFKELFEILVSSSKPDFGEVFSNNQRISECTRGLIYRISIMNYFSDLIKKYADLTQLEQFESEDTSGLFLYPINPSFMKDKESYQSAIDKLIDLNKLIDLDENKI
ncbi:MAG: hypothetical protein AAFX57_05065 [Bacteroidota bacterium]